MKMKKKKVLLFLLLGIVGSTLAIRHHVHKMNVIHFVEDELYDPSAKNFGAFPPEVPERLFDNLFPS